jgi:hypothetical protein
MMTSGLLLGAGSAIFTYDIVDTASEVINIAEKDVKTSSAREILELNIT